MRSIIKTKIQCKGVVETDYMNISQAAEKWGITLRRVQVLCKNGAIPGVTRLGRAWVIPSDAQKPVDGRTKAAKAGKTLPTEYNLPMPKKNPLLVFTDLYSVPGTADEVIESLKNQPEAAEIVRAQFDYYRGNTNRLNDDLKPFFEPHSGFNAVVSEGMHIAKCAMWLGNIDLWRKARQRIYEAPCEGENEREILDFWLAATDSTMHDTREFPKWFTEGRFSCLPSDSYPVARVFYIKYLFINAHRLAKGEISFKNVEGMGLMKTMPYFAEPMISQAHIEKTLIPEIYLRLIAATIYHDLGENSKAIEHVDKAIELCLPDKLYNILVEYRSGLDSLLDERLALVDDEALKRVKELYKRMRKGWIKLHNKLLEKNISETLTVREREVAKLAAFGLGNNEIAKQLNIEVSSVKSYIFSAMNRVGAEKRSELGRYI